MTKRKKYKILDLITEGIIEKPLDGNHGNTHPKSSDYVASGIPFIMATDIVDGRVDLNGCKFISRELSKTLKKGFAKTGDVLLTHKASIGRTCIVPPITFDYVVLTPQVTYYRVKDKTKLDNVYLKYYFRSKEFQDQLNSFASAGSTRAYIGITGQQQLSITIPKDLPTQNRISEILSALDDKIELNGRMNQTLEQMAQTLFRQYFMEGIDEENLPEEWRKGKLGDIVDVKGGTTPSTKQPEFWNGSINWTSPKDLSSVRFPVLLDTEKKITVAGLKKISSGLLPVGTLLLSSRAPIGYLAITQIPVAINQGYIAILCEKGYSTYFMLYWLKENMSTIIQNANGSTFLEISKSVFKKIALNIPPSKLVKEFDAKVNSLFQKLVLNEKESIKLTQIRDTLLPKFISGEIDVMQNKAEDLYEPVFN